VRGLSLRFEVVKNSLFASCEQWVADGIERKPGSRNIEPIKRILQPPGGAAQWSRRPPPEQANTGSNRCQGVRFYASPNKFHKMLLFQTCKISIVIGYV
jgi:hypothetical protein